MGLWDYVGMQVGEVGNFFGRETEQAEHAVSSSLQAKVDGITVKAQRGAVNEITFDEKMFLKGLYLAMAAGGLAKGMPEASQLLIRYLDNKAEPPLVISPEIYQTSSVVKKAMENHKQFAAAAMAAGKKEFTIEFKDKGHMLIAEQTNKRLFYANNRFWLFSKTQNTSGGKYKTTWSVPDRYVFEDFHGTVKNWKTHSFYTEIPFHNQKLRVYDGLSKFLIKLGMAQEFDYNSEWEEEWSHQGR